MKKTILALSLLLSSTTVALAESSFVGLYAGASLGYVDGTDKDIELELNGYTAKTTPKGGLLGLSAGYNMALQNNFVLGIEGDIEFRRQDDRSVYLLNGVVDPRFPIKSDVLGALSIRPRLGYILNNEHTMAFVSGGLAGARIKRTYYNNIAAPPSISSTDNQYGWVASFGVEHFVRSNISVQTEARYADYGSNNVDTSQIYGPNCCTDHHDYKEFSLRAGVIFHF